MQRKNILWLDDEIEQVRGFAIHLEKRVQSNVDYAENVGAALELMEQTKYDYIVVDNIVPIGSVNAQIKALRHEDLNREDGGTFFISLFKNANMLQKSSLANLKGLVFSSSFTTGKKTREAIDQCPFPTFVISKLAIQKSLNTQVSEFVAFMKRADSSRLITGSQEGKTETGQEEGENNAKADVQRLEFFLHNSSHKLLQLWAMIESSSDMVLAGASEPRRGEKKDLYFLLDQYSQELGDAFDRDYDLCSSDMLETLDKVSAVVEEIKSRTGRVTEKIVQKDHQSFLRAIEILSKENPSNTFLLMNRIWNDTTRRVVVRNLKDVMSEISLMVEKNERYLQQPSGGAEPERFNVIETLDTMIRQFEPRANSKFTGFRRDFRPRNVTVVGVHRDFISIIHNLFENAVKHGFVMKNKRAWIVVTLQDTAQRSDGITISIESWGPKIEDSEEIYQPGVRGRHTLSPGSGMGLAAAGELCKKNGWKIRHVSEAANDDGVVTEMQGKPAFINTFYFSME